MSWTQDKDIQDELHNFYGYTVQYKIGNGRYTDGPDVPHVMNKLYQDAVVGSLLEDRQYTFRVRPYREVKAIRDYGWPSRGVTVTITRSTGTRDFTLVYDFYPMKGVNL